MHRHRHITNIIILLGLEPFQKIGMGGKASNEIIKDLARPDHAQPYKTVQDFEQPYRTKEDSTVIQQHNPFKDLT